MQKIAYAIIGDIHGNTEALHAVLAHAKQQGVGGYIFLGDYGGLGNTNTVCKLLCQFRADSVPYGSGQSVYCLSGNGEEYIRDYHETYAVQQMSYPLQHGPVHYECVSVESPARRFLFQLPKKIVVPMCGSRIAMAHSPADFFMQSSSVQQGGYQYISLVQEGALQHKSYNQYIQGLIEKDTTLLGQLELAQEDIFLFGHYHTQWHAHVQGKLFVNPGACGMPADYDSRASYSILSHSADGWQVAEHKVAYDVEKALHDFAQAEIFKEIGFWGTLYTKLISTGINYPIVFLQHAYALARTKGETGSMLPDAIWQEAIESWGTQNIE